MAAGVENMAIGFDLHTGQRLWAAELDQGVYRTLSAWSGDGGSGIAATTSSSDIIQLGSWPDATIIDPGLPFLATLPPQAGNFGFVAMLTDGRMVGIRVAPAPRATAGPASGDSTSPIELRRSFVVVAPWF